MLKPINVPAKKEDSNNNAEKILTVLERIGQIGIFILPIFYKININSFEKQVALIIMILSLILYYGCWLRFFINQKHYFLLYKPLWSIPLPMAVFPILYMFLSSVIFSSRLLLVVTVLLSIGHLPLSYFEYKNTNKISH
jgi:hypothetical protein